MPNRLALETSPYLLQHAHNPVDWYPWGPEALARARAEDKPLLLSVGYSACHWCHVMERESFEDPAIAAQMNAGFVNVKVDREERPDLDELYMRAVQAFSRGHGGWPMTVFLTPDGVPFFAGTYFPPSPRHGLPSFPQVLAHARRIFTEDKALLGQIEGEVRRFLQGGGGLPAPAPEVGDGWLEAVVDAAARDFDAARGGFGGAPKFPPHGTLRVLAAHAATTGDPRSLHMLVHTLDEMSRGGMVDLLRGGTCRYSVDADWCVPHFEKMLYDNAQLVVAAVEAWRLTRRPGLALLVEQALGFVLDELGDPAGGFRAALDADSEGEEGRFATWTPEEITQALAGTGLDPAAACRLLGVDASGSFEHGRSVLRLRAPWEALDDEERALLAALRPPLRAAQDRRVRPGLDDKVLTGWTALMISAFARAAAAFDRADWHAAAARAATFLLEEATVDGRLMRTWKGGRARIPAFADDHAFLVEALIDLHQADLDPAWLRDALALAEQTLRLFADPVEGGLFLTGSDAEVLVDRAKPRLGGAEPSPQGAMAHALVRLSLLCDRPDLRAHAEAILRGTRPLLVHAPRALGVEALAGAWLARGGAEVGLAGRREDPATAALVRVVQGRALPFAVLALVEPGGDPADLELLPWMRTRAGPRPRATAFVCQGQACQLPVTDPEALAAQLDGLRAGSPAAPV